MVAIISTGGKQYKVSKGEKIKVEKLTGKIGSVVKFDVLFVGDDKDAHLGEPFLKGAKVEGKIVSHDRHEKVTGIKHKAKKRYLVRYGHRQPYTEIEITSIAAK